MLIKNTIIVNKSLKSGKVSLRGLQHQHQGRLRLPPRFLLVYYFQVIGIGIKVYWNIWRLFIGREGEWEGLLIGWKENDRPIAVALHSDLSPLILGTEPFHVDWSKNRINRGLCTYCISQGCQRFLTISDPRWDQPISDIFISFCLWATNIDA